jgi:hypothetical protein
MLTCNLLHTEWVDMGHVTTRTFLANPNLYASTVTLKRIFPLLNVRERDARPTHLRHGNALRYALERNCHGSRSAQNYKRSTSLLYP